MKNILQRTFSCFFMLCFAALLVGACSSDDGEEVAEPLSIPTNVRLVSSTTSSLTFAWDAVNGASGYTCKLVGKDSESIKGTKTVDQTTVVFDNLESGTTYRMAVRADSEISNLTSAFSNYFSASTDASSPGPLPTINFEFPEHENDGLVRAFPGAEGGGMYTTGGRGGKVIKVTNLNDAGTGSLRAAISASGARTIVFEVDGVIELKSTLKINNGDVTIAGQTAQGDGICLKNYPLVVNANNVIIRYIRSRMGDKGNLTTGVDALEGRYLKNVIIDHCSVSWSTDECASFYANENFTMQWCIISESLRNASHEKGTHGYGAIWGGVNASYHHNLLAHHDSRNPRFDGGEVYGTASNALTNDQRAVDYRNCVVYNFSNYPAYGGEGQKVNFVGNYYKWGPASTGGPGDSFDKNGNRTSNNAKKREYFYFIQGIKDGVDYGCPSIYTGGNTNYLFPTHNINNDNWSGFVYDTKSQGATEMTKLNSPVVIAPNGVPSRVTTHTAELSYSKVLDYAGASFKRDAVDTRVVNDTRNGTAQYMTGSNYSKNGYIDSQEDVGGWPVYTTGTVLKDTDGDGIPDDWEDTMGLDKTSAADGNTKTLDPTGRYTNLEVYLHWLVKDITNGQVSGGEYISQ